MKRNSEQAAVAALLMEKAGRLVADGATVTAYATPKSASVTVVWPDDEDDEEGL